MRLGYLTGSITAFILLLAGFAVAGKQASSPHRLADSLQRKLDFIEHNAEQPAPSQVPTVMTEDEINDYFAAGRVKLPRGVQKVTFSGDNGVVIALTRVDFDEVRGGQRSANPLMTLFSGVHDVRVEATAAGSGGKGRVHVRNVQLDGMEVPRGLLEYFVNKYITPKYPGIGLDSEFQMPDRVDIAVVGLHKLTVTQK